MERKHAESGDDLLAVTPAAKVIGVHPQTLRRYESEGLISCFRTRGGERRFRLADLIAFRDNPASSPVDSAPEAVSAGAFVAPERRAS